MNSLSRKILIVSCLAALPLVIMGYQNFFYFRKGFNTPEIQYQTIFWMMRLLFSPLAVLFTVKFWRDLNDLLSLLFIQLAGFGLYTVAFWGASFGFCRLLTRNFDGRNRNLFNIIKTESFLLNILIYVMTVFIIYLWVYFERNKEVTKKTFLLEKSLAESEFKHLKEQRRSNPGTEKLGKIIIKNGYKSIVIPIQDIACFLSNGPYVKVVTSDKTHLLNSPLHELQAKLPKPFFRVHRSHIVNFEFIKEVKSLLNGDYVLLLKTGAEIRASRTYRQNMKSILGMI